MNTKVGLSLQLLTAPARHTSSKASRTHITVSIAGEWRDPLGCNKLARMNLKSPRERYKKNDRKNGCRENKPPSWRIVLKDKT